MDDLLKIDGVVAAGEFGLDGSLVGYQASVEFPKELAQATAQFTALVTQLFNVLAGSFSNLNEQFAFAPSTAGPIPAATGPSLWAAPRASSSAAHIPVATGVVVPRMWPADSFDVIWSFTLAAGDNATYYLAALPELLLAGDAPV